VSVKRLFSILSAVIALATGSRADADFDDLPEVAKPATAASPAAVASPTPEASRSLHSASGKESNPKETGNAGKSAPSKSPSAKPSQQQPAAQSKNEEMEHNSSAPVAYSAQSLEGSLTQGRILLKGNVEIEQADAIMKSDVAEIFSKKGDSTPQRAVAKGRVSLFKAANANNQELRAVANELEYFMSNRKVILKGKPKIWRGRELLQGEIIEVFLETNEIKVRGARGVMEPAAGNPAGSGVQNPPAKKPSQTGRR
jgi:lipopolysaccharide transport protein LptA